jgi:hypothetical protein
MKGLLGSVVCLLLAACADDVPSGDRAGPTSQPDSGYVVSDRLVSQTAGGGRVAETATPLPDDAAVARFTRGLADALAVKVRDAVHATTVASGQGLYGQVIAVGCDVPAEVLVERDPVAVRAEPVASPRPECFAPVTTVALVVVEQS